VQRVGIPKDEALRMASTYPAQYIGLGQTLGRIAPDYQANLTVFDSQIYVSARHCKWRVFSLTSLKF
jgi:N-acetylglucosamine-6-phosphate deacetylase